MKKSKNQKIKKSKNQKIKKSKTRKQKGGDICEKNDILTKLDNHLNEYNNMVRAQEKSLGSSQNTDYEGEKNNIIMSLFEKIKKCDDIKSLIKRKRLFSFLNSDEKEFYDKLLKEFKSLIEQRIVRELSKSLKAYKESKSTKMSEIDPRNRIDENYMPIPIEKIIESEIKIIIESLYGTIKNYDKDTITDIIKKQNRFSFLDSDKKEFYEKILEKLESQNGQQDYSQGRQSNDSIKD